MKCKGRSIQTKEVFVSKCRDWKLKDDGVRSLFQEKVQAKAAVRSKGDGENMWNELKGCLLEASEETYGRTKGRPRHMETWWWTEDVSKVVKKKKRTFKIWKKLKNNLTVWSIMLQE